MIIPKSCIKWLNLQRTGYKHPIIEFKKNIKKEYDLMQEYLPDMCNNILDIGCGIAGIDVLLFKHYAIKSNEPELWLLDKSEVSKKIHYGYHETASSYNSFDAVKDFMNANYIKKYNLIDVSITQPPNNIKFDLIISLLSCGYHYPLDYYLDYIEETLTEDGTLIIDCRQKTDGPTILSQYFKNIKIISSYNKSDRVCARREYVNSWK